MSASEDYFTEKKNLISDFNEGKLQIFRLNESWQKCAAYSRAGNLIEWNWELDIIWRELAVDADYKDSEDDEKFRDKIKRLNILVTKSRNYPAKLYRVLEMKEIVLRRLQDMAGKGARRRDESEEGME